MSQQKPSKTDAPQRRHRTGWQRRKRERPEEILEAARLAMDRWGPEDIRMQDIAECAGIAKGTIYLYFSGKDDLLQAVQAGPEQG